MEAALDILLSVSFWAAAVRIATPLILGTLGELICERAGVLNLGIEGIFTAGAMVGWLAVYFGADLWVGVGCAALIGVAFGLLHGTLTVPLALSQHVSGIGVTLIATSLSYFTYRMILPDVATPPRIAAFRPILGVDPTALEPAWRWLAIVDQTPLTYFALVAVAVVAYVLYRTPLGLAVRAVGENPAAAESQGIDVIWIRLGAVMVGSALMAIGGAFLTMSAFNAFFFEMVAGRGWICIALVVFASWRPGKALFGALLFGAFDAFQVRLQQIVDDVPYQIFLMMPYVLSIAALIAMSRRAGYPQALLVPYRKGER